MRVVLFLLACGALFAQDVKQQYETARALAERGNIDEAVDEYRKAIRLRSDHAPSHVGLAKLLVLRREYSAAMVSVDAALKADPSNLEAQLVRASALIGMGKPGVARLYLLDTLKQHPESADVHFQLGMTALADRRFEEAQESFRNVWRLEPDNVRGLQGVVETWFSREEPKRAMAVFESEAERQPKRADLQEGAGNAAARAEQYDIAIARYRKAIELSEKPRADLWARIGDCYRVKSAFEDAVQAYRKAVDIAPGQANVRAGLALALDGGGHKAEAAQEYRAVIKLEPKHGAALNNLAFLLADNGGDLREALEFAQRARDLLPNLAEVTDTVGWIYLKSNMTDAALDLFQRLVLSNATNPSFRFHFGMAKAQKGDVAGALEELRRALTDKPSAEEAAKIRAMIEQLERPKNP